MFLPTALSRTLYRVDDALRGRGVWKTYRELSASSGWSRDRLDDLRNRKLRALVEHAAAHSPYYREVFAAAGLDPSSIRTVGDLAALPLLDRETVRSRGGEIRSRRPEDAGALPNSTGGSTGSNVRFWVDRGCWRRRDAASLLMWDVMGLRAGMPTVLVWGSPMDESRARRLRGRIRMFIDNKRFLSAYRIGDREIEDIVATVARSRPQALHGYPSVIDRLATHVRRRGLPWPRIPGLAFVSASETLFPEQRQNIATSLGARVVSVYGCREFGCVAVECARGGGLHVLEERVVVELLPTDDGPARVVVTDLDNYAFPFLRYEIGDLAEPESSPCPCGRPHARIASVRGRAFDVVRGPDGKAVGGTFWSLLLRTAAPSVETWQVVQTEIDEIEIRVTPESALGDVAEEERVRAEVRRALGDGVRVTLRRLAQLEPLASGKHRFVVGLEAGRSSSRVAG